MMLTIATRQSPLALAQAQLVSTRLGETVGASTTLLKIISTGDRRQEWSLSKAGGKGLFTAELEESLLRGTADLAVHSAKDLPGEMAPGLVIAGYLKREDPADVLVYREGVPQPRKIATSSPRRRLQLKELFPETDFTEIRGNVDTRLKKIARGDADATVLAAAGLNRLGIHRWPGLKFRSLTIQEMVPAVGQAAIAIQCRSENAERLRDCWDLPTFDAVTLERAIQAAMGAGCQTALGAHATSQQLHLFHESHGRRVIKLMNDSFLNPVAASRRMLRETGLVPAN